METQHTSGALPITASDIAASWNPLYDFLIGISLFFFVIVIGAMVYFTIRYHSSKKEKPDPIQDNHALELAWTVIPTILVLIIFAWGYIVYRDMVTVPSDAIEIRVIGKQWLWNFQYPNGEIRTNELYAPVNQPVKLIMTSEDVLHSFFIPGMRVKKDVVPGAYSTLWFEANMEGKFQVYCAEYCGAAHSGMLADLYVLDEANWNRFLQGRKLTIQTDALTKTAASAGTTSSGEATSGSPRPTLVEQGKLLTKTKGCIACHSDDGSQRVGPSYKGLFQSERTMADGSKVIADENYIRESIEYPQKQLVKGYPPTMPTFKGIIKEEELNAIIAYIKSVKE